MTASDKPAGRRPWHRLAAAAGALGVCAFVCAAGWRSAYVRSQVWRARSALRDARFEAARRHLYAAEKAVPDDPELLFLIGRLHRRAGPFDEIASYLDRSEQRGWPAQEVQQQRQLALLQSGQLERADAYLTTVLRSGCSDETADEVYEALARGAMATYRLGDALVALNFWLEWRPQTARARLSRASLFEQINRHADAVADCEKILELDPAHVEARRKLADNLVALRKLDRAEHEYRSCLEVVPGNVDSRIGVARCQAQLGHADEALVEFEKLLDVTLSPRQRAVVLLHLGRLKVERKDVAAGIDLLTQALEIPPVPAETHQALGTAYSLSGRKEWADQQFQAARRAARNAARLAEITEALVQQPDDADLRWEIGALYMEQDLTQDGLAWFRTALLCAPHHQKTHAALARYYRAIGERALADRHQELAHQSQP